MEFLHCRDSVQVKFWRSSCSQDCLELLRMWFSAFRFLGRAPPFLGNSLQLKWAGGAFCCFPPMSSGVLRCCSVCSLLSTLHEFLFPLSLYRKPMCRWSGDRTRVWKRSLAQECRFGNHWCADHECSVWRIRNSGRMFPSWSESCCGSLSPWTRLSLCQDSGAHRGQAAKSSFLRNRTWTWPACIQGHYLSFWPKDKKGGDTF